VATIAFGKPRIFLGLIGRIICFHIAGSLALFAILYPYLSQYRASLLDARIQILTEEAAIIATAITATSLGETNSPADNSAAHEVALNPDRIAPKLRELISSVNVRARVYDRDGGILIDSRDLYGASNVLRFDLPLAVKQPDLIERAIFVVRRWFRGDLPTYLELPPDKGKSYPEVMRALDGQIATMVRLNEHGADVVSVAVPIQRFRAVPAALVLTRSGDDIDVAVKAELFSLFKAFAIAAAVVVGLSLLFARTISAPAMPN
jgi:two-component system, OmpR family, sensor histidine kinase ChvG